MTANIDPKVVGRMLDDAVAKMIDEVRAGMAVLNRVAPVADRGDYPAVPPLVDRINGVPIHVSDNVPATTMIRVAFDPRQPALVVGWLALELLRMGTGQYPLESRYTRGAIEARRDRRRA